MLPLDEEAGAGEPDAGAEAAGAAEAGVDVEGAEDGVADAAALGFRYLDKNT